MDKEGVEKAIIIIDSMRKSSKKLENAMNNKNSDLIMEAKKEIAELQKQLASLI